MSDHDCPATSSKDVVHRPHPQAPAQPAVMRGPNGGAQSAAGTTRRLGLWAWLLRRSTPSSDGSPDEQGRILVAAKARIQRLPRVPGQDKNLAYTLVTSGLAMPPGCKGYVVEHDAASGESKRPFRASVVAYVDEFGRAFSVGSLQAMPPACAPDVQFKHYTDEALHGGCVEVATAGGRLARLAEYDEGAKGAIHLVGSRVHLGDAANVSSLAEAVAVAFVALWLLPRSQGVSLSSVSVKDILAHLRTPDLFAALDAILTDAGAAEDHPLLAPPGVLVYLVHNLRLAGLANLKAADLMPHESWGGMPHGAGAPFIDGLPGMHEAPTGSLMAAMRAAFEASGIPGLGLLGAGAGPAEPKVRLVRTSSYANAFYVGFDRRHVSAEGARKLLEAESLLNRFVLMVEALDRVGAVQTAPLEQMAQLDRWLIDQSANLAWPYVQNAVPADRRAATGSSELDVRLSFARGCESLRLPFRLEYGFRFDSEAETLVVDVECPSAVLMPRTSWDAVAQAWRSLPQTEREGLAARYALHLMVTIACVGFWAGDRVRRMAVNCWHGLGSSAGVNELAADGAEARSLAMNEPACVATAVFERERFAAALATEEGRAACAADPFAFVGGMRHSLSLTAEGHLGQVRPLYTLDDPVLHPEGSDCPPELDDHVLTERGATLLHAKEVSDLRIYENTVRKAAAEEVVAAFRVGGHEAALSAVKDIHDRTENLLLRSACLQVSEGIASGAYTGDSKAAIAEAFSDIYGMQAAMERAHKLMRSNPSAACAQLERMLAVASEQGWFADTPTRKYRYFDSYASRIMYSLRCAEADDGRSLRLPADEYYLGYYRLATIMAESLDHGEEAIAYARRCVELAPSVAASHLRLARCYFCVFDYRSEIGALYDALRVAWNPTDVGMALYWLGYALCMVDEYAAGVACYQACSRYDGNLAEPAAAEIADFARRRPTPIRKLSEAEERAALEAAGIDLDTVDANVEFLVQAAGAVTDVRSYALARNLLSSAEISLRDDAVPPVLESLED